MAEAHYIGATFQGTYRLERVIGEGGMGVVYEASHCRLSRRFAIKLLFNRHADDPQAQARFEREAQIAGSLGHPHLVEVIDFNRTSDGCPYIVMELLVGEDLASRLGRVCRLSLAEAVEIARQTASALQAVHQAGVVHRDLKPQNIYLCRSADGSDNVKVVDFGVSKLLGSAKTLTRTGTLVGSPYYMAPEQALERSAEVDARTDVYALGAVLFEMLAGSPPFLADSLPTLLYRIVNDPVPSLVRARPDVPAAVARVVERAMSKKPADRFPSMRTFWSELAEAADHPTRSLSRSVSQPGLSLPSGGSAMGITLPMEAAVAEGASQGEPAVVSSAPATGPGSDGASASAPTRRSWRRVTLALVLLGLGGVAVAPLMLRGLSASRARSGPAGADRSVSVPARDAAARREPERPDSRLTVVDGRPALVDAAPPRNPARPVGQAELNIVTVDESDEPVVATLRLDGDDRGQSPAQLVALRPGLHRLEVSAPGFRAVARRVLLRPGRNQVTIHLQR